MLYEATGDRAEPRVPEQEMANEGSGNRTGSAEPAWSS